MKKFNLLALLTLSLYACQNQNNPTTTTQDTTTTPKPAPAPSTNTTAPKPATEISDKVKGDFDGDGQTEEMWLEKPQIIEDNMECVGDCICTIRFSNPNIPSIPLSNCIGGQPVNHGNLNGRNGDEIGVLPTWFTSCWRSYEVFTLKNNKWLPAVEPISTHCQQWENNVEPIKIDPNKKGFVIISYSEMSPDDILTKSKSVKIQD